jgi:chitin disaccharide deacetylase
MPPRTSTCARWTDKVAGKRLIVTADDFGAATSVNEAIELAHRSGILNTASLMVSGRAVEDAVFRAKRMPALRVGLHVTVTDAPSMLDPTLVPLLANERGELSKALLRSGLSFAISSSVRAQLAAEIRAQFEAFRATGLALDHVNGHNHMHIHPTVLSLILEIGREYGMRAVRVPYEPFLPSWRSAHTGLLDRAGFGIFLFPMVRQMRARLRRHGITFNDFLFGISDTGRMTSERVLRMISKLPEGLSEMHFHPATAHWPGMPSYARCEDELAALTNPEVENALKKRGVAIVSFSDQ